MAASIAPLQAEGLYTCITLSIVDIEFGMSLNQLALDGSGCVT
jgi:hypothetical protein